MTDQDNTAPAVWDPTARGGAGGWVRRRPGPAGGPSAPPGPPPMPAAPPPPRADDHATALLPPVTGGVGDEGPPIGARPYVTAAPPAQGFPPAGPPAAGAPPFPPPQGGFPPTAPPGFPPAPPGRAPHGPGEQGPGGQGFPGRSAAQTPGFPGQGFPGQEFPAQAAHGQGFPGAAPAPFPGQGGQPYGDGAYGGQPSPGYGGPSYGYEDLDAEEPPARRTGLLVGIAVALVVLIGGGTVWALQGSGPASKDKAAPAATGGAAPAASASAPAAGGADSPSPSAPPTASPSAGAGAQAQAKALDALLARGESAKAPIGSAVAKVTSCPAKAEIDSAAQVFDDGARQRDQLVSDLSALDLGDLPGGSDAAALLKTAWQQSGDIDRAYAAWARTVSSQGCNGSSAPNTSDRKRANDLNPQATQSKKDFVAKWNAIASTYGLTERTWDRI